LRLLKNNRYALALAALFFLSSSGCVVSNSELLKVREDVDELKRQNAAILKKSRDRSAELIGFKAELDDIRNDLEPLRKNVRKKMADSSAQLDDIRAEFQQLFGRFEEVKHYSEKSSRANSAFIESADSRMKTLEIKNSAIQRQINDLAQEISALKVAVEAGREKRRVRPGGGLSPDALYKMGLDAIRAGKVKEARRHFQDYLEGYPDGPLANNAQFWIGESYYFEKDYERSIIEYEEVIKKYPSGGKVPAAMLKQAMAFNKIKDNKAAVTLFNKLVKKFPDSEEATIARKKLKKKKKK